MVEIATVKGELYSYDEATMRIFKDGVLLSSVKAEPVFSGFSDTTPPKFSGILLKDNSTILSLSGKLNTITDINAVI